VPTSRLTPALTLHRFAAELHAFASQITEPERAAARRCLADALACAAAGAAVPAHTRSWSALSDVDGAGAAVPVWFTGTRAGLLTAAYLNSLAVSAHDLDDGHRGAMGHPGGAVIPAALAEAELTGSTVDVLDAVVVGYEAGCRVAAARDPALFERSATGRWASLAVAAVSCFLHRDPPGILAHALAHAGSLAPQLSPPDPRAVDGLKEGTPWAVVAGLVAARLARAGIPGPTYLLERHTAYRTDGLAGIGARHPGAILHTYFKRYACCRWIHPVLDCLLWMDDAEPLDPDSISSISVLTFERSLRLSNRPAPRSVEEAHYSFPFCVGLAVTAGAAAFLPLRADALGSRRARGIARRVTLRTDAGHDAAFPARTPATVRVQTAHGTREMSVPTAHGDPSLPFPDATLRQKHRRLVEPLAPALVEPLARLLDADAPFDLDGLLAIVAQETKDPELVEDR
jgi:2-methylcitrate dehydratase PrpD